MRQGSLGRTAAAYDSFVDDDDELSVKAVLAEFKAEVARRVRPEDVETHLDLAVAYHEMGLNDEAAGELSVVQARLEFLRRSSTVEFHYLTGEIREARGDIAGALVSYRAAAALDPGHEKAVAAAERLGKFVLLG